MVGVYEIGCHLLPLMNINNLYKGRHIGVTKSIGKSIPYMGIYTLYGNLYLIWESIPYMGIYTLYGNLYLIWESMPYMGIVITLELNSISSVYEAYVNVFRTILNDRSR